MFARPDHEQALIAALIKTPEIIPYVTVNLREDHFFTEEARSVYKAIISIVAKDQGVTYLTVQDIVGSSLLTYLNGVVNKIVSVGEAVDAAQAIINQYVLREAFNVGAKLSKITDTDDPWALVDEVSSRLFDISQDKSGTFKSISEYIPELVQRAADIKDGKKPEIEYFFGLKNFEDEMRGFNTDEGELVVVSGRPGHGKSSAFNNYIIQAMNAGRPLMMWSGEMSNTATLTRYFAGKMRIESWRLEAGVMLDNNVIAAEFEDASRLVKNLHYNFGPMVWEDLKPSILHYHMAHGCRDFIIDRLELLYMNKINNEDERIKRIMGELRLLCTKYKLRVLIAAQMRKSAEDHKNGRPMLADVLAGTAITNDATKVILLNRPEARHLEMFPDGTSARGMAEWILAKNSYGPVIEGHRLNFTGPMYTFKEEDAQLMAPW